MASLFEIDQQIQQCVSFVDETTGEVINSDLLDSLIMEREKKLENVACWIKNLKAELEAIKAEEKSFADRKRSISAKIDSLERYLIYATDGQKFSTGKCSVSFRSSESVEIPDETLVPKKFLKKTIKYAPDKTAIKEALKSGLKVKGCSLMQKLNPQIK